MRSIALVVGLLTVACRPTTTQTVWHQEPDVPPSAYEHYVRGRLASIEGDHRLAVAEFRLASAIAPDQPELRVSVAEELLAAGLNEHARQELGLILKEWPSEARAWRLLGRTHARAGDIKKAIGAYEKGIAAAVDEEEGYLLLAAAHRQLSDAKSAEKVYERLVAKVPLSIEGHFRLGRSLLQRKELLRAEKHLKRAIQLEPAHIDARVSLAETHRRAGRPSEAGATLKEAFDRSGDDPSVGERLFRVLLEAGDLQAAVELVKTLDADWRDPSVRVSLGYLYLQLRKGADAIKVADAVLARDEKHHHARILKARGLAQARQLGDAVKALSEIPADAEEFAEARAFAAELLGRDGKVRDGIVSVEEALVRWPASSTLIVARASLYERHGDVEKARAILAEAATKKPDDEELVYASASFEERNGDVDTAVKIMHRLLDVDADNVLALNFIGYLYANRGVKLDDAERLLAHAVELRPDDGYVLDSWGWYLVQKGRLEEAREALERADRLAPFEPEILLHLGELYVRLRDAERARETFERALALDPDDRTRVRLEEGIRTVEARRDR